MQFKQFYLGCLSHASYYIGSETEAVVIDPQRDVQQYLNEAEANNQKIKYIIETHSHADFVSGHIELANKSGAEIIYGEKASTQFPTHKVKDGDELNVGKINLRFMETPGHTPEGITILAENMEDAGAPLKMFTGDALFIGDVGRPDLVGSKGYTAEQMGAMMYDSLRNKILPLSDDTEVYPAHGAGSLCGKSLSKETWSTLGEQRRTNYALQPMSKEEFIKIVAADQPEAPAYFAESSAENMRGAAPIEDLPKPASLTSEEIRDFGGVVLDTRSGSEFGAGHVPSSINIGLEGQFAPWAGSLITIGTPIAVVAENHEKVDEAFMRLARVGIETVKGYILIADYDGEIRKIEQVSVDQAKSATDDCKVQFVDVRRPAEHASGHARKAMNLPLDILAKEVGNLDPEKPTYVLCQGGYRSSLGTSILENAGFKEIYNVTGGTKAWMDADFEMEVSAGTACANSSN